MGLKRLVSVVISLMLIGVLCTGAAWAKANEKDKGKKNIVTHELKDKAYHSNFDKDKNGADTENNFTDVKGHWANSIITKMTQKGIFKGYDDGSFHPDDPITELETVALADRITGEESEEEGLESEEEELGDIPGWAKKSVREAVYKGAINLNRFHSQKQCERVQAAVIIAKSMGLTPADAFSLPFKDGILISPEDAGYVMALYNAGIISGTPDGKFNPNKHITRAEMAVILANIDAENEEESSLTDEGTGTGDDGVAEDTEDDGDTGDTDDDDTED
jgi:hypothetical protein